MNQTNSIRHYADDTLIYIHNPENNLFIHILRNNVLFSNTSTQTVIFFSVSCEIRNIWFSYERAWVQPVLWLWIWGQVEIHDTFIMFTIKRSVLKDWIHQQKQEHVNVEKCHDRKKEAETECGLRTAAESSWSLCADYLPYIDTLIDYKRQSYNNYELLSPIIKVWKKLVLLLDSCLTHGSDMK